MKLYRPKPTFDVSDAPVYGDISFTYGSPKNLTSPDAFDFAKEQGFLQSVGQAVVARVAFHKDNETTEQGLDGSDLYQKTSTVTVKFPGKKGLRAAFVELPNEKASYELVKDGFKEHSAGRELILPVSHSLVAKLIEKAQDEKRVVDVLTSNPLKLGTNKTRGRSEYGKNEYTIALFGNVDLSEMNAEYLHDSRNCPEGYVWDFTASDLEKLLQGKEGHALIRSVVLGGDDCSSINIVNAYSNFVSIGLARGVVPVGQKISTGSQGLPLRSK